MTFGNDFASLKWGMLIELPLGDAGGIANKQVGKRNLKKNEDAKIGTALL